MQRAARLHQAGDLPKAVQLYEAILLEQPRDFDALYGLAIARLQEGQLEDSLQAVRQALSINNAFADGWCVQGMLLLRLNQAQEALSSFNAALALKPDFAKAHGHLGNVLKR